MTDRFGLHYVPQHEWHLWHALWFWAMGIGSAIFLVRQCLGVTQAGTVLGMDWPDLVGIVLVAIGGLILILDLGRPWRVLNALLRPQTSWISRGAIADFSFLLFGILYVLAGWFPALPWSARIFSQADIVSQIFIIVAGCMAIVIMVYPGFVLYDSLAIPLWNSIAVPVLFFEWAVTSAIGTLWLIMGATHTLVAGAVTNRVAVTELIALGVTVVTGLLYLFDRTRSPRRAAQLAVTRMVRGPVAPWFWAAVVVGFLVPIILIVWALSMPFSPALYEWAGVGTVLGSFGIRYAQLLAGIRQTAMN